MEFIQPPTQMSWMENIEKKFQRLAIKGSTVLKLAR